MLKELPLLYLKGMRTIMFQLSGSYYTNSEFFSMKVFEFLFTAGSQRGT